MRRDCRTAGVASFIKWSNTVLDVPVRRNTDLARRPEQNVRHPVKTIRRGEEPGPLAPDLAARVSEDVLRTDERALHVTADDSLAEELVRRDTDLVRRTAESVRHPAKTIPRAEEPVRRGEECTLLAPDLAARVSEDVLRTDERALHVTADDSLAEELVLRDTELASLHEKSVRHPAKTIPRAAEPVRRGEERALLAPDLAARVPADVVRAEQRVLHVRADAPLAE